MIGGLTVQLDREFKRSVNTENTPFCGVLRPAERGLLAKLRGKYLG